MRIPTVQVQTQAVQTVVFLMIVLLVILVSSDNRSEKRFFFSGEIVACVAGAEGGRRRKSTLPLPPLSLSFSPIMRLLCRLAVSRRKWTILDPSATRLKMSLTISAGRTKKFEVCYWLTKNECAFHFSPARMVTSSLARFAKRKAKQKWRLFRVSEKPE